MPSTLVATLTKRKIKRYLHVTFFVLFCFFLSSYLLEEGVSVVLAPMIDEHGRDRLRGEGRVAPATGQAHHVRQPRRLVDLPQLSATLSHPCEQ